ncbi:MAG: DUF3575 domain-containing protein [Saprospiraceae bacterium]
MKTKFLTIASFLMLFFLTNNLIGQNVIKVNPIGLAFGSLNGGYETFLNDKSSLYLKANFYSRGIVGVRYTGFGVGGEYRFYLSNNERPKGLYAGPVANIGFIGTNVDGVGNYTLITLGGVIGYQWVFSEKFTVEVNIGPVYGIATGDFGDTDIFGDGILPTISLLTLGYILN